MPIYMLWLWAWIRLFGTSEWALRAANIPWFVVGAVGLIRWSKRGQISSSLILVMLVCLSPFLWFYLNEVRPYIMQFAGAALFLGGVLATIFVGSRGNCMRFEAADCWAVALGAVLLCGTSLLGVPWLLAGLLVLALSWRSGTVEVSRSCLPSTLIGAVLLLILAVHYVGTLRRGAGPYINDSPFFLTLGFSFYELLGFVGLGPSRLDLRQSGISELRPFVPVLLASAIIWTTAIGVAARRPGQEQKSNQRLVLYILALVTLPLIFLGVLSEWRSFRVLGRHMTPLLPVLLLVLGATLSALRSSSRSWHSLVLAAPLLLWAFSAASWRVSERHRKDDYQLASQVAAEALRQGKTVWWAAHYFGAAYYGLPLERGEGAAASVVRSRQTPAFLGFYSPRPEELRGLSPPDLLIISKADTFDGHGALYAFATDHGYQEPVVAAAFRFYSRKPAD